jgi:hypothetical protein
MVDHEGDANMLGDTGRLRMGVNMQERGRLQGGAGCQGLC